MIKDRVKLYYDKPSEEYKIVSLDFAYREISFYYDGIFQRVTLYGGFDMPFYFINGLSDEWVYLFSYFKDING